jgi:predicted XRE-type DNA-binding protein
MNANNDARTVQALRSDLALQIARHIRSSGQSQVGAAKRLAVPQPTVSQIMHGKVSQLSLELLIRIAVRAGLPVVLQTGKDAEEAGVFVAGEPLQESRILRSKVDDEARQGLSEDARNLTPQERLEAHARHSQLMVALHRAGQKSRRAR